MAVYLSTALFFTTREGEMNNGMSMKRLVVRRLVLVSLILGFSFMAALGTATAELLHTTLNNGMTVVIKENHAAPVVTAVMYVRAGHIFEEEYLGAGISHYCEHLVAMGTTTNRTEAEADEILNMLGGASNAYTTSDHTAYYISTSREHLETAIDLVSDWVLHNAMDPHEVEREHGVITREIEMGEDEPRRRIGKLYNAAMFVKHPEHHPTIGYKDVFLELTRDDLVEYYQRMYVPNNMIFVIAGDLDAQETLGLVEKYCADAERKPLRQIYLQTDPVQMGTRRVDDEMDIETTYLMMGWRTVKVTHPDLYALHLLEDILSRGESSRLVKSVRDDQQLVHTIAASSYNPCYDAADYTILSTLEVENVNLAEQAILAEIDRLRRELVTPEELAKAKNQRLAAEVFANQTARDQAMQIGQDLIRTGNPLFRENYLERIKAVTAEDIRRVVETYFQDQAMTVAVLHPTGTELPAREQARETAVGAVGEVHKVFLDNGLTLLLKSNPHFPLVSVHAFLKGGVLYETEEDNGRFNLTARMLRRGTKRRTAEQIAEQIDALGGHIGSSAGHDLTHVSVEVLAEHTDKGLDILADILQNPVFDAEELDKERQLVLAQIDRQNDDWRTQSEVFFQKTFYRRHPYRFAPVGQKASVSALTRDDLVATYEAYYVPNNMVLAIFGDIDLGEIEYLVKKRFGKLEPKEISFPEVPAEPPLEEIVTDELITDRQQTVIYMGYPGMKLGDPDWHAMRVIDGITSGIGYPGGWLHNTLRGNQLVYFVHAWNDARSHPGYYAIQAATNPATADTALDIILEKQRLIKQDAYSDDELEQAKSACIVMQGLYYNQTNADQAAQAATDEIRGLGYDYADDFEEKIRAVTREDIQRVARKYFQNYGLIMTHPEG
jgi:zinc protease